MITSVSDLSQYPAVLAIDQAQHSGFAACCGGVINSWHHKFPMKKRESKFLDYIIEQIKRYKPEYVCYEDIRFSANTASGQCAGMWRGLILAACQIEGVETIGVNPGFWKLHMTGHGGCKKPKKGSREIYLPIAAVNRRVFVNVTDDNEADALCILITALETGLVEKADA